MRQFIAWLFGLKIIEPCDTFETHECVLCKRDLDASYCIPKPTPPRLKKPSGVNERHWMNFMVKR